MVATNLFANNKGVSSSMYYLTNYIFRRRNLIRSDIHLHERTQSNAFNYLGRTSNTPYEGTNNVNLKLVHFFTIA